MKLKFGHYFAADAWLKLRSFISVEILNPSLVKILKFKFGTNADIGYDFDIDAWSNFRL